MNILLTGDSQLARRIIDALMHRHQIVCIRPKDSGGNWDTERLNAHLLTGEPTHPQTLREAGVETSDVFIGATNSDERNIVACITARRLGAKRTICVVNGKSFFSSAEDGAELSRTLGIDQVVRPIDQLAQELTRIILTPGAIEVQSVAGGRLSLFRYLVSENAAGVHRPLAELDLPVGSRLVNLRRGAETLIPRGDTVLLPGDKVMAMGLSESLIELGTLLRAKLKERHEAVIVGGGRVGRAVARALSRARYQVKVIDTDPGKCRVVSERTPALALLGDGTDVEFLTQERVGDAPVVVAVTSSDERNLLVSLIAKQLGARRVVTRADRLSNELLFEQVGVDVVRSAKGAALRSILQSIDEDEAEIHAELEHGAACVFELTVPERARAVSIAELNPPSYAVVGGILRGDQTIVPTGKDVLMPGDHLFVFCAREDEEALCDFYAQSGES